MPASRETKQALTTLHATKDVYKKLAVTRSRIEQAIANQFNGDPKKLAGYQLTPSDHELASLLQKSMQTSGKRIRGWLLIEWYQAQGGTNHEAALKAAVLIEAIHTASLLIDDVQDNSPLRRGKPTVLAERGAPVAISAGLSLLLGATNAARSLPNGELIQPLVIEHITQLAHGQTKDVTWHRDAALTTTQAAYERMCAEKTGKLFTLAIHVAEALAGVALTERALRKLRSHAPALKEYFPDSKEHAMNALELAGVIYQLTDDVANITTDLGKEFGEDIRERKITALTIVGMRNTHTKTTLQKYYRKRGVSANEVTTIIGLLQTSGVVDAVRERICELYDNASNELTLARLPQRIHQPIATLLTLATSR
jgi:geranylgeranyl pyrophosphate synthase